MKTQLITVTKKHWKHARESYKKSTKITEMNCPLELAMQEADFIKPSVSLYTFRYYTEKITNGILPEGNVAEVGILSKGALLLRRLFDQSSRMPKLPQEVEINLCTHKEMKTFTKKYLGESTGINKYYDQEVQGRL